MNRLKLSLENCYGIRRLEATFDFSGCQNNAIYAPNGTMKSSLARVFKDVKGSKTPHGCTSSARTSLPPQAGQAVWHVPAKGSVPATGAAGVPEIEPMKAPIRRGSGVLGRRLSVFPSTPLAVGLACSRTGCTPGPRGRRFGLGASLGQAGRKASLASPAASDRVLSSRLAGRPVHSLRRSTPLGERGTIAPPPPGRVAPPVPLNRPARPSPLPKMIILICRTLTQQVYMADRPFRWYPTRTHRTRYVDYSGRHDGSSDIFELIRGHICRTAGPSLSILDVGCSTGVAAAYLKEKMLEAGLKVSVSGIDPAPEVFKEARRNLDGFYEGNIEDVRIGEKFDIVLCARLLRFAFPREQKRLVRACAECCAPGGVLVLDGVPVTMRNTYHMVSAARAGEYGDLLVSAWEGLGWRSRQGRAVPLRLKRSHRSAEHRAKCALGDPVGSAQAALGAIRRVLGP